MENVSELRAVLASSFIIIRFGIVTVVNAFREGLNFESVFCFSCKRFVLGLLLQQFLLLVFRTLSLFRNCKVYCLVGLSLALCIFPRKDVMRQTISLFLCCRQDLQLTIPVTVASRERRFLS